MPTSEHVQGDSLGCRIRLCSSEKHHNLQWFFKRSVTELLKEVLICNISFHSFIGAQRCSLCYSKTCVTMVLTDKRYVL